MEIYLRDQAKRLFYSRDIPVDSIGVFQSHIGEWIYWFNDDWTYDTGFSDTESEALQIAKKNFRPHKKNYDII
jgi:hypothetical protein